MVGFSGCTEQVNAMLSLHIISEVWIVNAPELIGRSHIDNYQPKPLFHVCRNCDVYISAFTVDVMCHNAEVPSVQDIFPVSIAFCTRLPCSTQAMKVYEAS